MDTLIFGLTVTVIGISIVFAGLIVLIGLIKLIAMATSGMGKSKKAEAPKAEPAPAAESASEPEDAAQDDTLIAVITAAVAAMMEDGSAFTVRRVRRVNNAPAWGKAGREDQIFSRF